MHTGCKRGSNIAKMFCNCGGLIVDVFTNRLIVEFVFKTIGPWVHQHVTSALTCESSKRWCPVLYIGWLYINLNPDCCYYSPTGRFQTDISFRAKSIRQTPWSPPKIRVKSGSHWREIPFGKASHQWPGYCPLSDCLRIDLGLLHNCSVPNFVAAGNLLRYSRRIEGLKDPQASQKWPKLCNWPEKYQSEVPIGAWHAR